MIARSGPAGIRAPRGSPDEDGPTARAASRVRSWPTSDEGSASVEFIALGVLLLVPLTYLMITVFSVQSAAYGVSAAARDAGRAYVQAPAGENPGDAAYRAAWIAMQDHGIDLEPEDLTITCSATPCMSPGSVINISVDVNVALALVPDVFGEVPASVSVEGRHSAVVDLFRTGG